MYEIIISEKALKQIGKLEKEIQKRIFKTFERIRIRPEAYITKLVNEPAYKLRVGDYRVILDTLENSDCTHSSLQRGVSNRNFRRAQNTPRTLVRGSFDIDKNKLTIFVITVGHRRSIYKDL